MGKTCHFLCRKTRYVLKVQILMTGLPCGKHLDIRHCTITLHLHTLPCEDVLRGHFGGMDHCCPRFAPQTANPPLGKVVQFWHCKEDTGANTRQVPYTGFKTWGCP